MLRQEENGGVLQQKHDNLSGSSSEERPHLSEAQIAADEFKGRGVCHNYYRPLYNAAQEGDWKIAKFFIDNDPNALTARITIDAQTVVHVAALYCQWGFVLKLLERLSPESIAVQDEHGDTVLHYVAKGGSLNTAKALIEKNPALPHVVNNKGELPLHCSNWSESNELVWYLTLKTKVESSPSLHAIVLGLIDSGFLDVALYFVRNPELALPKNELGSLLLHLAINPSYFLSGSNLGFLESWIYRSVHAEWHPALLTSTQPENYNIQVFLSFKRLFWKAIARFVPFIKVIQDAKLKHECAVELVNYACRHLSTWSFEQIFPFLQNPVSVLTEATTSGTQEIIKSLLQYFPDLIYYDILPQRNILQVAIEHRQRIIVNMIKDISLTITKDLCSSHMELGNTNLHLAGKLASPYRLRRIPGAAFQMQNELQWFKEVEKHTLSHIRKVKNHEGHTAKEIFTAEHEKLAEQGEKWMKDTVNSCMVVSTLIATVLFTAAFTVPGGNLHDRGIPIFLRTKAFTVFIVSNALGLLSSLISLLMFLAIITTRYEIDDFLESLPKMLIIGLSTLFFALVSMITAFGATVTILLSEKWHWISIPITLVASSVTVFVIWHLRLFWKMVKSVYGPGMFRP